VAHLGFEFVGNSDHLNLVYASSAETWNRWREANPTRIPDLWTAVLQGKDLAGWNLRAADLRLVNLHGADLRGADLREARLRGAILRDADLRGANLRSADLAEAELDHPDGGIYRFSTDLRGARLAECCLVSANLTRAHLDNSQLVMADLSNATLDGASVYGISSWDVNLHGTRQRDLRITRSDQPYIAVDQLELAQFIYLLMKNERLRYILDTISSKTVLILGRFTDERLEYLELVKNEIRRTANIPIVFDFAIPESADMTGTVETLCRLVKFVIADVSDPRSVPHELASVVPFLRMTPVLPLRDTGAPSYAMLRDLYRYPWMLDTLSYRSADELKSLLPAALEKLEAKAASLRGLGAD
jgi:uncharacterized protein YjbI with pentapeptide repeats